MWPAGALPGRPLVVTDDARRRAVAPRTQCRRQAAATRTDNQDVIWLGSISTRPQIRTLRLPATLDNVLFWFFWESLVGHSTRWRRADIGFVTCFAEVGPRLKRVRTQARWGLETEGRRRPHSKRHAVSDWKSGQRTPKPGASAAIAQAHQIPLDELVGSPEYSVTRGSAQAGTAKRWPGRPYPSPHRQPRGAHAWNGCHFPAISGGAASAKPRGYDWLKCLAGNASAHIGRPRQHDEGGRGC